MTVSIARREADEMALRFLRDEGPHSLPNPLDTEEAICACLIFIDLAKRGLARKTDFGGGHIQFSITDAGRAVVQ